MSEVCFNKRDVRVYSYVFISIVIFLIYILYEKYTYNKEHMSNVDLLVNLSNKELMNKIKDLENKLYETQIDEQKCQSDLNTVKTYVNQSQDLRNVVRSKIYDPLVAPERIYPGGRLNITPFQDYQQIGFVYSGNERFPLYGRYKYPGRSEKWEYYIIDETRNRLKIPFKSPNDNELYDGNSISIPTLGEFSVKIYEFENIRYNPNV